MKCDNITDKKLISLKILQVLKEVFCVMSGYFATVVPKHLSSKLTKKCLYCKSDLEMEKYSKKIKKM